MSEAIPVLIADDEHLVRKGIVHLLSQQNVFQIVAEAGNGEEGVNLSRKFKPRIIIMDVRMPVLDGLAALEKIREIDPQVKTIILSGYSDFAYAQKALKLGATDYLLKPTDLPGLLNILLRLKEVINNEDQEQIKATKLKNQLSYGMPAFMEQFYWQLLGNEFLSNELKEKMEIMELKDDKATVLLISMDNCYQCKITKTKEEYLEICAKVKLLIQEFLGIERCQNPSVLQTDQDCFILIYYSYYQPEPEEFSIALKEWLKKKAGGLFTISIGSCQSLTTIYLSYAEAVTKLKQRLILGGDRIIAMNLNIQESNLRYPVDVEKDLAKAIRFGDIENAQVYLDKIFQTLISAGNLSPNSWQQLCFDLLEMGFKIAREMNVALNDTINPYEKGREISLLTTVADIRTWLDKYIIEIINSMVETKSEPSFAVKKAISYIDEHFAENLTLSALSTYIGISPNYLSQILKQETGKTFLEHLTNRRLEEAKRLLKLDDLNISEVSYKVGYDNPRYFSEVFHKLEKITPGQYRKSIR